MRDELKSKGLPFFKIIKKPHHKARSMKPETAELVSLPISNKVTNPPKDTVWNKVPTDTSC